MDTRVFPSAAVATSKAADWLIEKLLQPQTLNIMVAAGATPLPLYGNIARRKASLSHLNVFALDDYVGVPEDEPRNCANLLRQQVVDAWGIPRSQYHWLSSCEEKAGESINRHEATLSALGGLDVVILGLGRNGHLGFNEPGSPPDSIGRVVALNPTSVEANRRWFDGDFAPSLGVTSGLQTILSARSVLLLAFGAAKADAVFGLCQGPPTPACPASFLQSHPNVTVFLDDEAAARLTRASTASGAT